MSDIFGDSLFTALEKNPVEAGKLLIAAPDKDLGAFSRSVHLIIAHEGMTAAIDLTRRSEHAVVNFFPDLGEIVAKPQALFLGGPVGADSVHSLGVLRPGVNVEEAVAQEFIFAHIGSRIVSFNVETPAEVLREWISAARLFVGHSAWDVGQLQEEIDEGLWFVADALASDIIAPAQLDVWAEALRRQPLPLPLFATMPLDTHSN